MGFGDVRYGFGLDLGLMKDSYFWMAGCFLAQIYAFVSIYYRLDPNYGRLWICDFGADKLEICYVAWHGVPITVLFQRSRCLWLKA